MSQAGIASITKAVPSIPLTFTTDSGVAVPASNNLNVLGGTGINTSAVGDTITIDCTVAGPGTITGNSGGAQSQTAGNWNLLTANSTVKFVGSASTFTQDFNQTNLTLGTSLPSLTSGNYNVSLGSGALPAISSGSSNTAVGYISGNTLSTGSNNTALGFGSLQQETTGGNNTAVGYQSLQIPRGASNNTAVGYKSGINLTTGSQNTILGASALSGAASTATRNLILGYLAGSNYGSSESNNIIISNSGTAGESNVMRLGTTGSSAGQVNKAYLAGVASVSVGNKNIVTIDTTTGQMGSDSSVAVGNGGTGTTTLTDRGVLIGRGTAAIEATAAGTAGQVLQSGGAGVNPSYSTATYPSTTTANQLLYSSANNTVGGLATTARSTLTTNSSGVPTWSAMTDGQIIIGSTSGSPAAATLSAGSGITITNASNSCTIAASNTNTTKPAFLAYVNTTIPNVTGNGTVYTIIYDTEVYDQNGDFNLATSTFTAPVTGKYLVNYSARLGGGTSIGATACTIVTSNRNYLGEMYNASGTAVSALRSVSVLVDMDASDTLTVQVQSTDSGGKIDDVTGSLYNYLSCVLIC